MAATLWWQRRLTKVGGTPLLDLAMLRTPSFRAGLVANTAFMCYFGSFMFTLTLFLQVGLGLDAYDAGLVFAPAGMTFALGALGGRRVLARFAQRAVAGGSLLTASSLGVLAVILHATGARTALAWVVGFSALASLGNGVVLPSLIGAALTDVVPERAGLGAGAISTAQQFAGAIGVATIGALFFSVIHGSHGYPSPWRGPPQPSPRSSCSWRSSSTARCRRAPKAGEVLHAGIGTAVLRQRSSRAVEADLISPPAGRRGRRPPDRLQPHRPARPRRAS